MSEDIIELHKVKQWADLVDYVPKADFFMFNSDMADIHVSYNQRRVVVEFHTGGVKTFPFHASIPYTMVCYARKQRSNNVQRQGKTERERMKGVHKQRELNRQQRAADNRQRAKSAGAGKKG